MDDRSEQESILAHFTLSGTEFSVSLLRRKQRSSLMMNFPSAADDKPREQLQRSLPKVPETGCSDECSHNREAAETRSSTPEMPAVSAFFSLAALAEVAAMENVHRLAVGSLAALGQLHPFHRTWVETVTCKPSSCLLMWLVILSTMTGVRETIVYHVLLFSRAGIYKGVRPPRILLWT